MTSGGGSPMKDALGAERERARCRRLSETSDVALANVFRRRDARRTGPVLTGRVCQRSAVSGQRSAVSGQRSAVSGQRSAVSGQRRRPDAMEAFEDQWSAAVRTTGTVVFAGVQRGTQ